MKGVQRNVIDSHNNQSVDTTVCIRRIRLAVGVPASVV